MNQSKIELAMIIGGNRHFRPEGNVASLKD